jgi:hypothetical protein
VGMEGLGKLKEFDELVRNLTCDILACSTVPQLTTLETKILCDVAMITY